MENYIIVKQFTLRDKTYYKDRILTAAEIGESIMPRLLARGYIKQLREASASTNEILYSDADDDFVPGQYNNPGNVSDILEGTPTDETKKAFFSPEQVNKLKRAEALHYAFSLGISDLDTTSPLPQLREAINAFIQKEMSEVDDEDTEDEEYEDNPENEDA